MKIQAARVVLTSLVVGLVTAAVITIVITVWEWLENPGDVFRGADVTHWNAVLETAVSWFLPSFGWVFVVALAGHVVWRLARQA